MYLTLSAENMGAEEALAIGLVSRVVEPEALVAEAEAFAHRIAGYPRPSVVGTKRGFLDALETGFEAATRAEEAAELACFQSPDTRRRLREFAERKRS